MHSPVENLPVTANPRRWLILGIAASALFLICIDLTVLYVALPALARDLDTTNAERLWILNAYSLVVAGMLPGLGTLGDRYGHRRLFLLGLAVFGLASLAAAYAPSAAILIAARAVLGIGGAMMMPATLAIIRTTFTDEHERTVAIGLWSGIAAGGMALGPLVAGALLEHYGWGAVFLINVPVVMVALLLTLMFVPQRTPPGTAAWDLAGSLQILVGLTCIVHAIKELAQQQFSLANFSVALIGGAAFVVLYLRRQSGRAQPLIDLTLFRVRGFSGAFAAATLGTAGVVGIELVMSQYLQLVQQRTALQAALTLLPTALGGFISGPLAGRILRRYAAPVLASSGFVLAAASVVALGLNPINTAVPGGLQLALLLGIGLGIGATVTCASSVIMNAAPPERGGMAASIEEVGFELGGTLGVALFGSLMTIVYAASLVLPDAANVVPAAVRDSLDEAIKATAGLAPTAAAALLAGAKTAFSTATAAVLLGVGALWLATAAGIQLAHIRGKRRSRYDD